MLHDEIVRSMAHGARCNAEDPLPTPTSAHQHRRSHHQSRVRQDHRGCRRPAWRSTVSKGSCLTRNAPGTICSGSLPAASRYPLSPAASGRHRLPSGGSPASVMCQKLPGGRPCGWLAGDPLGHQCAGQVLLAGSGGGGDEGEVDDVALRMTAAHGVSP